MRNLSGNKKAFSTLEIIVIIVLVIVVLSFLIDPNGGIPSFIKKLFGMKDPVVSPYEACFQKPDGAACTTKDIPDGLCIKSGCVLRNSPAYDLDHAKLLFKTTLKQNLERCKTEPNTCNEVAVTIQNVLSFVDDDDESKVVLEIEILDSSHADFRLRRVQSWLSSIFRSSNLASFRYNGAICSKPSRSETLFYIGKGPKGYGIFYPSRGIIDKNNLFAYLGVEHQEATDASSPVCMTYDPNDKIPWWG
ncbi:hypothetical protein JXB28_00815 [Candidatus Woesearchaeota archaeon]|nr:hypothetical protein [Candidatus Woesearchaeota archaeon]